MTLNTCTLCGALAGAALLLSLTSCQQTWTVSGDIRDTDNTTVYLESQNSFGRWSPIDSAKVTGDFKFSQPADGRPDIYRLRIGDTHIYFPVTAPDEHITVTAQLATAGTDCRLAGTPQAELMDLANTYIYKIYRSLSTDTAVADSLKRALYTDCMAGDTLGLVSYYVVTKRIDGVPVYNPEVRRELGIIGAVANSFNTRRPDDPRTRLLNDYFIAYRPKGRAAVSAQAITIPEITLTDENGRQQSLTGLVDRNKAVILNFTAYAAENSGAVNLMLRKTYDALHDSGLDIYQVDVLSDRSVWRHAAVNLPWTTVYAESNDAGYAALAGYQVNADNLPLTFIITADGITRVTDLGTLQATAAAKL